MSGRGRDVVIAIGMSIIAMGSAIGIYKGFLQEQGPVQLEAAAPRAPEEAPPAPAGSAPREGGTSAPARAGMTPMGPVAARELAAPTDLAPRLAAIEKLLNRHGIDGTTSDGPRLDQLAAEIERLRADIRRLELLIEQEEPGDAGPAERPLEPSDQEVRMRPAQTEQVAALELPAPAPAAEAAAPNTLGDRGESRAYNVQPGDTLTGIARKLCLPVGELQSMNPELRDVDQLRVGQALRYRETQECSGGRADRNKAAT